MTVMKVHAAIAKALDDNGVDTMFGLVGDANLYMVDSFIRDCGGKYFSAVHEGSAVLMALGYSQVSGRLGVATVTHGPGLTNTLTALIEGVKAQIPMVLLCGDTAVEARNHLQNTPQREHVLATGAGFEQLRAPQTLAEDIATAIRRAWLERRPIALNVPVDFQWCDIEYEPRIFKPVDLRTVVPESDDLDNAIGIIAAARRPVVLAGRGAADPASRAALLRLAERIEAPIATTLRAKDLFRGEPFDIGISGTLSQALGNEVMLQADCIIAFGASLNAFTMALGAFEKGKRIVQVDCDPAQIGLHLTPHAGVVGDAGRTADLFVRWLDQAEIPGSGQRSSALAERLDQASPWEAIKRPEPSEKIDLTRAVLMIDEAFPVDRLVVSDTGRFIVEPWKNLHVPAPENFVMSIAYGSIGLGMGYAIGAGAAKPSVPLLHVTGDGGFMMGGLNEFHSAVRHKIDIVVLICNDGAYGAEHVQLRAKNMDPALSMFAWPDFAKLADAMGGQGFVVRTFSDLRAALDALPTRDRPILIDMRLDPDTMPSVI